MPTLVWWHAHTTPMLLLIWNKLCSSTLPGFSSSVETLCLVFAHSPILSACAVSTDLWLWNTVQPTAAAAAADWHCLLLRLALPLSLSLPLQASISTIRTHNKSKPLFFFFKSSKTRHAKPRNANPCEWGRDRPDKLKASWSEEEGGENR